MQENHVTGSGLNPREEAFARGLVEGKPVTVAWQEAGYAPSASNPWTKLAQVDFRAEMRAIMEKAGLTREKWAETVTAGATGAIQHGLTKDGAVVPMGPDWHARAKLLELGAKVYDMLPNPRLDVEHTVRGAILIDSAERLLPFDVFADVVEGESVELDDRGGYQDTDPAAFEP